MQKAADAREHIRVLTDQLDRLMKIDNSDVGSGASASASALPAKPVQSTPVFPLAKETQSMTSSSTEGCHSDPKLSNTERLRLKRAALEPPSPEKGATKRHQSYSKD